MTELPIPDPEGFDQRKEVGYSDEEALRLSTDLFFMATGLKTYPTVPFELRMVNEAIYQMAWYLQESHENQEAMFSPFSSERIGSYSYSKMAKAVQDGDKTGVDWFDRAVEYFSDKNIHDGGLFDVISEKVFPHGFENSTFTHRDTYGGR